jgi:hypothetical protein
MVRVIVDQVLNEGKRYIEAAGLSTDTKPTTNVVTGSLFLEVDTGDVYAFAEGDSPAWNQIAALGGGT